MKKKSCEQETEVITNLEAGSLTPENQEHVSECPLCKETVSVHLWMNQFKNISLEVVAAEKTLPTPESIWRRANPQYKPYSTLVKKALRPLLLSRLLAYGIITVGIIVLLFFFKLDIKYFLESYISFEISLPLVLTFIIPMIFICLLISFGILANTLEKRKSHQPT